jgi:cyclophilin family peptidyl-prolyl cis-trans isomerase
MTLSARSRFQGVALGVVTLILSACRASVSTPGTIANADSALVARVLLAEDRRDSLSTAVAEAARHTDSRIRTLARRATARIRDSAFAARDSLPTPSAAPAYPDPAWRLRFRALAANTPCAALRIALGDSAWPVRFRAAALAPAPCAGDAGVVQTLRSWAETIPASARRSRGAPSWQHAAHGIVNLARIAPAAARPLLPRAVSSTIPSMRAYAARAAGTLADTATLRRLARDPDDNVKEAAIVALSRVAGHGGDDEYIAALSARGYQAVRVAARALAASPRRTDVLAAALAAARRLRNDSSETSRDARAAVLERIAEFATPASLDDVTSLAGDFDCAIARSAAGIATRLASRTVAPVCSPLPIVLPPDAVPLALGRVVHLRVTIADSSGGGSFVVRLRGDVAPIMAARVLALARSGYYDGLVWQRAEHDFVLQGGGPGANEYVGHPRFMRDELGAIPHPRGTVGMSTRGHDTGDGQWFINLRDNARLTRDYTVFAEIVEGMEVVDGLLEGDVIGSVREDGRTRGREDE